MRAYPTTPNFIKNHLFGKDETDPAKLDLCRNLAEALNAVYLAGIEDGAAGIERGGKIARLCWAAFAKNGALPFLKTCKEAKLVSVLMMDAYQEGRREEAVKRN